MKNRNIKLSPLAEQDLVDIWEYMSVDGEAGAKDFLNSLHKILHKIPDFPLSGVPRHDVQEGLRLIVFKHYNIFYSGENSAVLVVRILHGSREVKRFL